MPRLNSTARPRMRDGCSSHCASAWALSPTKRSIASHCANRLSTLRPVFSHTDGTIAVAGMASRACATAYSPTLASRLANSGGKPRRLGPAPPSVGPASKLCRTQAAAGSTSDSPCAPRPRAVQHPVNAMTWGVLGVKAAGATGRFLMKPPSPGPRCARVCARAYRSKPAMQRKCGLPKPFTNRRSNDKKPSWTAPLPWLAASRAWSASTTK